MSLKTALHGGRAFILIAPLFFGPLLHAGATPVGESEVSVRLRPLKGVITVAGTNVVVRSADLVGGSPLVTTRGFDRLAFRFAKENGKDAWIVSDPATDEKLAVIDGRKTEIRGENLRIDLRPAPSHVQLIGRFKGRAAATMDLVGFLSVENYLEGVVAGEVPRDWPMEALKAQAVAARSFTFAKMREREALAPEWLLDANVTDQVFDLERVHSRAAEAVRATRGEVITNGAGQVMAAHYHADCGGKTDEPGVVWSFDGQAGPPGSRFGTAVDRGCAMNPRNPWRVVTSFEDLTKALMGRALLPPGFQLASLSVVRRSAGGRVAQIQAGSNDGRFRNFSGERLREALGYREIKSTLFELKPARIAGRNQIEFVGRGFGHGSGLCQWGSRQLALNGRNYREILQHYYPLLKVAAPTRLAKAE